MPAADVRASALAAAFAERFGRPPAGVWAAPGRVNLIGEHTDYNEGFALPFALDRLTVVAVGVRPDRVARCSSAGFPDVVVDLDGVAPATPPSGWSAYPVGVAWALGQLGHAVPGFDLLVESDVPGGAGVSSSAALECAVALALDHVVGAGLGRRALAAAGRRAENDIAGAPTGVLDQLASLLAHADHALLLDCRSLDVELVPLDLAAAGLRLLVLDTRVTHELVGGEYGQRRADCDAAAQTLGVAALRDCDRAAVDAAAQVLGERRHRRARHVVTENARVLEVVALLQAGAVADIGPALTASHASLRDDYEVSCPELDVACAAAEDAGALGARMTGGGFGGSAIALAPVAAVPAVTRAVRAAAGTAGFATPDVFEALPAEGARRLQ